MIDDTAVTPKYVHGFEAKRELPIIGRIVLGSIKNKLIILLPLAMLLANFLPQAITPLLMIGGASVSYTHLDVYKRQANNLGLIRGKDRRIRRVIEVD